MVNADPEQGSAFVVRDSALTRLDLLLLLMCLIWGTNYAVIKSALRELDPQAFNALRMALASVVMIATSVVVRRRQPSNPSFRAVFHTPERVTRPEWMRLVALGLVGHCVYQYLFIGGLAKTTVANSSLLLALSPIVILLMTVVSGTERTGVLHWVGTLLSLAGIYIVIGRGARLGGDSLTGDMMMGAAMLCWSVYTFGARPLMVRHSPVGVTALSMVLGTIVYVPLMSRHVAAVPWTTISTATWIELVYSAVFSIAVAYTIWYAGVRAIGSARTSVYSNLLPIVAMVTAYIWLHEPLGAAKLIGASAVLVGVALTRVRAQP
jgi:drug/metabolite transporter (DMT)-like permease